MSCLHNTAITTRELFVKLWVQFCQTPYICNPHLPLILLIHLQYVLHDVLELPLLHPKPAGDAGHVTGAGDGGQLPREVNRQFPIVHDRRFASCWHFPAQLVQGPACNLCGYWTITECAVPRYLCSDTLQGWYQLTYHFLFWWGLTFKSCLFLKPCLSTLILK